MATRVKNDKQFLVIKSNLAELSIIEGCFCPGICDACNRISMIGHIIPVLGHSWYCAKCYRNWLQRATNYPDDQAFEQAVYDEYVRRFEKHALWNGD